MEVLLHNRGTCNLTTLNAMAFVNDGIVDYKAFLDAQRMSARAGLRMTLVDLEMHGWAKQQAKDRLLGCSLTGWQDMVNAADLSIVEQKTLLADLRNAGRDAADTYAAELGINSPMFVTTVKPEGTLSQLPGVSSGLHYSHSPYFKRRVRINSDDPICKVAEELGYNVFPENGQEWETCTTKVVEFPVKAPEGDTKYDISAIKQLENYKIFMESYVDMNASITIHVRNNEWEAVGDWLDENWNIVVGVSFLSLDDSFYPLLPYEACTKDEYEELKNSMKPFNPSLISKFEKEEIQLDIGSEGCDTGSCPVR